MGEQVYPSPRNKSESYASVPLQSLRLQYLGYLLSAPTHNNANCLFSNKSLNVNRSTFNVIRKSTFTSLLLLCFVPEAVHFFQGHVLEFTTLLLGALLHIREAGDELAVGALQGIVGIDAVEA